MRSFRLTLKQVLLVGFAALGLAACTQVDTPRPMASDSFAAIIRIERNLRGSNPSHTLILYGTNDWNDPACMAAPPCYTPENLRVVVQRTWRWRSLPTLLNRCGAWNVPVLVERVRTMGNHKG